ncbi:MAG TPA: hypothetical protein VGC79_14685 [Polyangiaceae bacterium]
MLAVSLLPSRASAKPSKDQCVDADTQAQDLRREGKLLSARDALRFCTDPACPRLVREDCTQRLDELTSAVPSLIFSAKDATGRDLSAVTVTIDGKPLVDHLDGSAIEVDPGQHTFEFEAEAEALPPTTLKLLVREGERGRHSEVLIGPPAALKVSPPPSQPETTDGDAAAKDSESATGSTGSTQRVLAWTALGLGTAGLVVGSVFGLKSKSKHDDAKACGTTCPDEPSYQANEDALKFGNISTVAFIVGAVGLAGGVTLWLTAKPSQASSSASARVGVGLGSLQFRGSF